MKLFLRQVPRRGGRKYELKKKTVRLYIYISYIAQPTTDRRTCDTATIIQQQWQIEVSSCACVAFLCPKTTAKASTPAYNITKTKKIFQRNIRHNLSYIYYCVCPGREAKISYIISIIHGKNKNKNKKRDSICLFIYCNVHTCVCACVRAPKLLLAATPPPFSPIRQYTKKTIREKKKKMNATDVRPIPPQHGEVRKQAVLYPPPSPSFGAKQKKTTTPRFNNKNEQKLTDFETENNKKKCVFVYCTVETQLDLFLSSRTTIHGT